MGTREGECALLVTLIAEARRQQGRLDLVAVACIIVYIQAVQNSVKPMGSESGSDTLYEEQQQQMACVDAFCKKEGAWMMCS